MDDREEWLARTFVELVDTLVADFDLMDLMNVLVERCAQLLDSTDVGLALADAPGATAGFGVVDRAHDVQNDEGPCLDCYRSGEQVLNQRLDETQNRWPRFAPKARTAGFEMVHALPLRLRGDTIGAMNVFNVELHELTSQEVNLTQALATPPPSRSFRNGLSTSWFNWRASSREPSILGSSSNRRRGSWPNGCKSA